eukprot:jgi/Ulvmu1/6022/UM261_0001.1
MLAADGHPSNLLTTPPAPRSTWPTTPTRPRLVAYQPLEPPGPPVPTSAPSAFAAHPPPAPTSAAILLHDPPGLPPPLPPTPHSRLAAATATPAPVTTQPLPPSAPPPPQVSPHRQRDPLVPPDMPALLAQVTDLLRDYSSQTRAGPPATTLAPPTSDDHSMFAKQAASPPPTPRTAASRDLHLLMSTSPPNSSITDMEIRSFFKGLAPDMPTSALERVYNRMTDWSTNTTAALRMACQGLDQATGRLIGGLPPLDPAYPHDALLRLCRRMRDHCGELVDFPLPTSTSLTHSTTLQWVDKAARHAFGAPALA